MEGNVIIISREDALAKYGEVQKEKLLAIIEKIKGVKLIPGDDKSYDEVKKAKNMLVKIRRKIDKRRKELGDPARKHLNFVNNAGKELIKIVEPEEKRLKQELKEEDERRAATEKKRIQKIRSAIEKIKQIPIEAGNDDSVTIAKKMDELEQKQITEEEFQEFLKEATDAKHAALEMLANLYKTKTQLELLQKKQEELMKENKHGLDPSTISKHIAEKFEKRQEVPKIEIADSADLAPEELKQIKPNGKLIVSLREAELQRRFEDLKKLFAELLTFAKKGNYKTGEDMFGVDAGESKAQLFFLTIEKKFEEIIKQD